jgi:3-oxoacyl-[acyl-carrier-protein] synthase-1
VTRDVHIIAVGACTPVGRTAESSAAAIRAGISRVREHPFMVDGLGERLKCAYDPALESETLGVERLLALARHALCEVAAKVTASTWHRAKLPLLLALPECRPGFAEEAASWLQQALQAEAKQIIPGVTIVRAGEGHAGALSALRLATRRMAQGEFEFCVVAGVDSYFDADTLDWLDGDLRVARTGTRSGLLPGEGASMVALATNSARLALRLPSLARIRTVACTREKRRADTAEGLLGEALTTAITTAGTSLRHPAELVSDVYCDINGERERTDDWGFALLRTSQLFRDGTAYTTSVSQCGDLGAATPGLNCALATQAWQRGYARGPLALIWGASWMGLRGAAVVEQGAC